MRFLQRNGGFMKFLAPTFYIKSTSDEGHIEGYASVFNVVDEQGDNVIPGAFKKAIEKFKSTNKMPKMLWQHDTKKPIGVWEEIEETEHGLFVKGRILLDLKYGREAWSLLKNKAIDGLSIGYKTTKRARGKNSSLLNDIDLLEISIVTFPACPDASVETVKADSEIQHFECNDEDTKIINTSSEDIKSSNVEDNQSLTDQRIDAFAELIKAISRLTQMVYQFLK